MSKPPTEPVIVNLSESPPTSPCPVNKQNNPYLAPSATKSETAVSQPPRDDYKREARLGEADSTVGGGTSAFMLFDKFSQKRREARLADITFEHIEDDNLEEVLRNFYRFL